MLGQVLSGDKSLHKLDVLYNGEALARMYLFG